MSPTSDRSNILIVDDMEENLVALEAVLSSLDQRLVRARSGEQALKAMLRQEFAVVLLDVLMPGMDGFETAATLKRLDQTKDVPIILLTGTDADADYAYRGYAIGAADFLTKPFDPWLLRTKVNVFLELHRKNRQLAVQAEQLRRLLIAEWKSEGRTGAGFGESGEGLEPVGPEGVTRHRPPRPAADTETAEGSGARLAGISGQLARIERLLRDEESADAAGLADRVADLRRATGSLRGDDRQA